MTSRFGHCQRLVVATVIAMCACTSFASAQTATAPALTAAFLYNFAKFTEWPPATLAPGEPLLLCVINDRAVGKMLVDLTKGRIIAGHPLVVSMIEPDSAGVSACRLLFVSGLDANGLRALLASVAGRPVLTVSDVDRFAQLGGIAGLFVENGTMRFAINRGAAERAGLHLSSKLLSLATIVRDTP